MNNTYATSYDVGQVQRLPEQISENRAIYTQNVNYTNNTLEKTYADNFSPDKDSIGRSNMQMTL